ncbi:hypothetical protein NUACC21_60000 [Scytonema sp. NUACC21]
MLSELTSAYGTFATQGLHAEPHGITRILNRQGKVIWSAGFKPQRALDAESAAIMTWMLRSVVESGTGRAAQIGRPVAGKTGTTDQARDLWFIGYIPQLVTGVWLGNDDNKPTWGSSGSAAYTWHEFMEQVVDKIPVEKFPTLPKLAGRKSSIKAAPVKARRIINRAASSYNNNYDEDTSRRSYRRNQEASSDDSDRERTYRRRRYRRRYYQEEQQPQEYTPRRNRRYYQQQQEEETTTPRRRYRRRYRVEQSNSNEPRSRRRYRGGDSDSSTRFRRQYTPNTDNSSESSSPKRSWRERLRPTTPGSQTSP